MNLATELIKDALETISFGAVEDWLTEVFGRSTLSKRKALFKGGAGGQLNCMNF